MVSVQAGIPGRGEVDERDVDAFATLQFDAPRAGERSVAARLRDEVGQVAVRLRHRHVAASHPATVRVAHRHHCIQHAIAPQLTTGQGVMGHSWVKSVT